MKWQSDLPYTADWPGQGLNGAIRFNIDNGDNEASLSNPGRPRLPPNPPNDGLFAPSGTAPLICL